VRNRALIATLAAALFMVWQLYVSSKAGALFGDFRAFYCGGAAVAHGVDPYAGSSLYACERGPMPFGLYHAITGIAVPAPLPGYALLAFVPFGVLPYPIACVLWLFVLLAACVLCAKALALLLDMPFDSALWPLVAGFAVIVIPVGELGSIEIAAVLWMAVALRRHAWTWAAVAGAFAMILPHVGLPAVLCVFLFVAEMRMRIIVLTLVLALLDVLAGGVGTALAYVQTVIPAHANSEIGSTMQYGLTWVLHGLGASDRLAIRGGEVSYGIMVVLGVLASWRMLLRTRDPAYCALLAPAFAVFGGTFVHLAQIAVAIPSALLFYKRSGSAIRYAFAASAMLLAIPWLPVLGQPLFIAVFAAVCALIAASTFEWNTSWALRAALSCVLLTAVIIIAGYHFGAAMPAATHLSISQQGLAQSAWAEYIRTQRASTGAIWWIAKAPTWLGLALLIAGCLCVLRSRAAQLREAATASLG
jgi:hypothetical protein